jgi:hypothetical protein
VIINENLIVVCDENMNNNSNDYPLLVFQNFCGSVKCIKKIVFIKELMVDGKKECLYLNIAKKIRKMKSSNSEVVILVGSNNENFSFVCLDILKITQLFWINSDTEQIDNKITVNISIHGTRHGYELPEDFQDNIEDFVITEECIYILLEHYDDKNCMLKSYCLFKSYLNKSEPSTVGKRLYLEWEKLKTLLSRPSMVDVAGGVIVEDGKYIYQFWDN